MIVKDENKGFGVTYLSPWRGENGVWYTKALFVEESFNPDHKSKIKYTLKNEDYQGYPSLRRLYLEAEDVTEYEFANTYFENLDHWEAICKLLWFRPHIEKWRRELDLKIRARALKGIMEEAKKGRNALAANKYLLEKGYLSNEEQKRRKVGRPSTESIREEAERLFEKSQSVDDDLARLKEMN